MLERYVFFWFYYIIELICYLCYIMFRSKSYLPFYILIYTCPMLRTAIVIIWMQLFPLVPMGGVSFFYTCHDHWWKTRRNYFKFAGDVLKAKNVTHMFLVGMNSLTIFFLLHKQINYKHINLNNVYRSINVRFNGINSYYLFKSICIIWN